MIATAGIAYLTIIIPAAPVAPAAPAPDATTAPSPPFPYPLVVALNDVPDWLEPLPPLPYSTADPPAIVELKPEPTAEVVAADLAPPPEPAPPL